MAAKTRSDLMLINLSTPRPAIFRFATKFKPFVTETVEVDPPPLLISNAGASVEERISADSENFRPSSNTLHLTGGLSESTVSVFSRNKKALLFISWLGAKRYP